MKRLLSRILPWLITVIALYIAFRGIDLQALSYSFYNAKIEYICIALFFTTCSYLFRSRRWQYLFSEPTLNFFDSYKVLILGFFMNNILPARAGELVRAHLGSKVSGETRTLVLASIASERLLDGITISLLFVIFATQVGDEALSQNLFYVAAAFTFVTAGVGIVLLFREKLLQLADKIQERFQTKIANYTRNRFEAFLHGLSPLFSTSKSPKLLFWTCIIWMIEVGVFHYVGQAYNVPLTFGACVLFLVAVNFSSLIPAAPGGIGVIEAITTAVLVSIGIEKELALAMVLTQHVIQYIIVGIPGILFLQSLPKIATLRESEA